MACLYFLLQFLVGVRPEEVDNIEDGLVDRLYVAYLDIVPILLMTCAWGFFSMLSIYGTRLETRVVYMKNKYFFGWLFWIINLILILLTLFISIDIFEVEEDSDNATRAAYFVILVTYAYYVFLFGTVVAEKVHYSCINITT